MDTEGSRRLADQAVALLSGLKPLHREVEGAPCFGQGRQSSQCGLLGGEQQALYVFDAKLGHERLFRNERAALGADLAGEDE